jgi:hypothetical protein
MTWRKLRIDRHVSHYTKNPSQFSFVSKYPTAFVTMKAEILNKPLSIRNSSMDHSLENNSGEL